MSLEKKVPFLGAGLGLRTPHFETIVQEKPAIDWFEIISDNFIVSDERSLRYLDRIREHYPLVMHGVSLSVGGTDALDLSYLRAIKTLMSRIAPIWVSDHLCWTGVNGVYTHDLLPLPYTEEAVQHCANRIQQVQETLGRQILIENLSSYLSYTHSVMSEWEFLTRVVEAADCLILLDVNNVYVSAFNHGFDPHVYLDHLPKQRVVQVHLAGHTHHGSYLLDTHDVPVAEPVWELYRYVIQKFGVISTMIERDDNIPALGELCVELNRVKAILQGFS